MADPPPAQGGSGAARAELRLACRGAAEAVALAQALAADDGTDAAADGECVVVRLAAPGAPGLLRAIEDVLECARGTGLLADQARA